MKNYEKIRRNKQDKNRWVITRKEGHVDYQQLDLLNQLKYSPIEQK